VFFQSLFVAFWKFGERTEVKNESLKRLSDLIICHVFSRVNMVTLNFYKIAPIETFVLFLIESIARALV
jgi:hypothetical protein